MIQKFQSNIINIDDIHCNDRNVNDIAHGTIYGINNNT